MNVFLDLYPLPEIDSMQKIDDKTLPRTPVGKESSTTLSSRQKKKNEKYRWTQPENQRYIRFVAKNSALFSLSFKEKKNLQINKKMSLTVKSRSPSQCHTHHQKMMMKYGSIEAIVNTNPLPAPKLVSLAEAKVEAIQKIQESPFMLSCGNEDSKIIW